MKKKVLIILLLAMSMTGCGRKDAVEINGAVHSSVEDESTVGQAEQEESAAEQVKQEVDDIMAQADDLAEKGDIDSAISLVSDAMNSYPDYSDLFSQKEEAYEKIKEEMESQLSEIAEELDHYIDDNDFTSLFSSLESYKQNYPNLKDRLNQKKEEYIERVKVILDGWIVEADSYMAEQLDIGSAQNKLAEVQEVVNTDVLQAMFADYVQIVSDRHAYYYTYDQNFKPLSLMSENRVFDGSASWNKDKSAYINDCYDRYGNFYPTFFGLSAYKDSYSNVIFNAGGDYERFSASFVVPKTVDQNKIFVIEVYGDNVLLDFYSGFTSYDEPKTIEVDITGYKLINFKVYRQDTTSYWKGPFLILYDANFYNVTPTDFEYYKVPETEEINDLT